MVNVHEPKDENANTHHFKLVEKDLHHALEHILDMHKCKKL